MAFFPAILSTFVSAYLRMSFFSTVSYMYSFNSTLLEIVVWLLMNVTLLCFLLEM